MNKTPLTEPTNPPLQNPETGLSTPSPGDDQEPKGPLGKLWRRLPKSKIAGVIGAVIVLVVIIGAIYAYTNFVAKSSGSNNNSGFANQSLATSLLNSLNLGAKNSGSQNTLTVSPNTTFSGTVRVEQDLQLDGKLNSSQPLTLNGLVVSGSSNLGALSVTGGTNLKGGATISSFLNVTGPLSVTGNGAFSGSLSSNSFSTQSLQVGSLALNGHITTSGSTPSISPGGGLGNGGTAKVVGNDSSGIISLFTANSGTTGPGEIAAVTFRTPYTTYPKVILTPANASAPTLQYYTSRSTTGFTISIVGPPTLQLGTEYDFDYIVAQ